MHEAPATLVSFALLDSAFNHEAHRLNTSGVGSSLHCTQKASSADGPCVEAPPMAAGELPVDGGVDA